MGLCASKVPSAKAMTTAERELYDERAAIREHLAGLPRHEAEMRAFEDLLAHGHERHPRAHRGVRTSRELDELEACGLIYTRGSAWEMWARGR